MDKDFGIVSDRQGANCLISLSGRITVDSSPELRTLLMEQMQEATCGSLAIDFYEVEYVDTSVLAILVETLKAARACGKTFQLRRLRGRPRYLLQATSLLPLFGELEDEIPPAADSARSAQ
jgi:anti-sigma B factor antagonist